MKCVWTYSCCAFRHDAPKTAQETVDRIYEHQRDWHHEDPWHDNCTITEVEED